MIFGKTELEKKKAEQDSIIAKINGVKRFLWLPEMLDNGKWGWLCNVTSYYKAGKNANGNLFLWSSSPDSFNPIYVNVLCRGNEHVS